MRPVAYWTPLADKQIEAFDIPYRAILLTVLDTADHVCWAVMLGRPGSPRAKAEAQMLEELDKVLSRTVHLLWEPRPTLARSMAGDGEDEVEHFHAVLRKEDELKELRYRLLDVRNVAALTPRRRLKIASTIGRTRS
jgi:hypothetical protein